MASEPCPPCRGTGSVTGCCEQPLTTGECCACPVPVPCGACDGSGEVPYDAWLASQGIAPDGSDGEQF